MQINMFWRSLYSLDPTANNTVLYTYILLRREVLCYMFSQC